MVGQNGWRLITTIVPNPERKNRTNQIFCDFDMGTLAFQAVRGLKLYFYFLA